MSQIDSSLQHVQAVALAVALVTGTSLALAAAGAAQDRPLLLSGARILDASGERFVDGRTLRLENGRIARIAPGGDADDADADAAAGAERIDLSGLYVIPGLIDLHTHLLLHPYDEAAWDDQVLRESLELRTIRATAAAMATLHAGFTTVRELGTEGAGIADVALRDAIAAGIIAGPRIVATTRAIVATGCYGPSGFDPRWQVPQGAQVADGVDGVRVAVREQIAAGADWIKVYADYRRGPAAAATPSFSDAELAAIVDEARSAGLSVAAHATTDEGCQRAVRAGVRTIEHGYGASAPTLALMQQHGVVLCPTLAAAEAVARYAGWNGAAPEPSGVRAAREMFARALAAGTAIACGSDAGVFRHGDNAREVELMVAYGMSPPHALAAATSVAARVLGREREIGHVAEGFVADLVALRADPLLDPGALRTPALVVARGQVLGEIRR